MCVRDDVKGAEHTDDDQDGTWTARGGLIYLYHIPAIDELFFFMQARLCCWI